VWGFVAAVFAAGGAESVQAADSIRVDKDAIRIENKCLKRKIEIKAGCPSTVYIENKLTGHKFKTESEEFRLVLDDGATTLTARDFRIASVGAPVEQDGKCAVTLRLECGKPPVGLELTYAIASDDFYMRKWLTVSTVGAMHAIFLPHRQAGQPALRLAGLPAYGAKKPSPLLNTIEVERLSFGGAKTKDWKPVGTTVGQPVFVGDELFVGLEFPVAHNTVEKGVVSLKHFPGRRGTVTSKVAVLGICPNTVNNRVSDWFLRYIDRVRARPVTRFTTFERYELPTVEATEKRFGIARQTFNQRGARVDDFDIPVSGWVDPKSIMRPRANQPFPLIPVTKKLAYEKLKAGVGFHVNTCGSRPSMDFKWLNAQGYNMVTEHAYCIADPRAYGALKSALLELVVEYGAMSFKFDWGTFNCAKAGHRGHIAGLDYGLEAITENYIDLLASLRKANPKVCLYDITPNFSPWWPMWMDALWSQTGDYNVDLSGPPSPTDEDLCMTWRDTRLRRNFGEIVYPLSSLMCHEPILWGWGPKEGEQVPLDSFTDLIMLSYLRGNLLSEIYINIEALNEQARDRLAAAMRWGAANDAVLLADSRFILGDPAKQEPYGYAHFTPENHGLIAIRNPFIIPRKVPLKLDERAGTWKTSKKHIATIIYPYCEVLRSGLRYGDELAIETQGYDLLIIEIHPEDAISSPVVEGCQYVPSAKPGEMVFHLLGDPKDTALARMKGAPEGAATSLVHQMPKFMDRKGSLQNAHAIQGYLREEGGRTFLALEAYAPADAEAKLCVVRYVRELGQQKDVSCIVRVGAKQLPVEKHVNCRAERGRSAGVGWCMFLAPLPTGRSIVNVEVVGPATKAGEAEVPFTIAGNTEQVCGCWVIVDERLAEGDDLVVRSDQLTPLLQPPLTRPDRKRSTLTVLPLPQGFLEGGGGQAVVQITRIGAPIFTDRKYTITTIPAELDGAPAIIFSATRARQTARLAFTAKKPVRVYIAFGPRNPEDLWLDPQPGWEVHRQNAFTCADRYVGKDVYYKDFPAGPVELFSAEKGTYVVLGIAPQPKQ
jgi:hypothetical protein